MGTGRADGPRGTHYATKEENKGDWQKGKEEREETGEQGTMVDRGAG